MADWFWSTGQNDKNGPVSTTEVRNLAASGILKPTHFLWKEGMDDWVSASKVRGLVFKTATPPPPPSLPQVDVPYDSGFDEDRNDPKALADGSVRFWETIDQLFVAAQKAVRDLGYKVDYIDKTNGLLNFKTGMSWKSFAGQEMSIMMIDNGDGGVDVSITGRRNQTGVVIQVYDWGEAAGIATNVFAKMTEYLNSTPINWKGNDSKNTGVSTQVIGMLTVVMVALAIGVIAVNDKSAKNAEMQQKAAEKAAEEKKVNDKFEEEMKRFSESRKKSEKAELERKKKADFERSEI